MSQRTTTRIFGNDFNFQGKRLDCGMLSIYPTYQFYKELAISFYLSSTAKVIASLLLRDASIVVFYGWREVVILLRGGGFGEGAGGAASPDKI